MIGRPLLLLTLALAACSGKSDTLTFPAGLEPLEDNKADYPAAKTGDAWPETLNLVSGSDDSYDWTDARGYIQAPILDVWSAVADPDAVVDRRRVQEWTTTMDVEPDYDVSFEIANTSYDIVTVEFDIDWREGAVEGTVDAPLTVGVRWQKVGGTDLVKVLEGSAVLESEGDSATGVQFIEHLDTVGSDTSDIEAYLTDLYASVVAVSHGEDLPTYE